MASMQWLAVAVLLSVAIVATAAAYSSEAPKNDDPAKVSGGRPPYLDDDYYRNKYSGGDYGKEGHGKGNYCHCGDNNCPAPPACPGCARGLVQCGPECVNPNTNNVCCGATNPVPCVNGQICINGACQCPSGYIFCGGQCRNPRTDPNYCGTPTLPFTGTGDVCDTVAPCLPGQTCNNGVCGCPEETVECSFGTPSRTFCLFAASTVECPTNCEPAPCPPTGQVIGPFNPLACGAAESSSCTICGFGQTCINGSCQDCIPNGSNGCGAAGGNKACCSCTCGGPGTGNEDKCRAGGFVGGGAACPPSRFPGTK